MPRRSRRSSPGRTNLAIRCGRASIIDSRRSSLGSLESSEMIGAHFSYTFKQKKYAPVAFSVSRRVGTLPEDFGVLSIRVPVRQYRTWAVSMCQNASRLRFTSKSVADVLRSAHAAVRQYRTRTPPIVRFSSRLTSRCVFLAIRCGRASIIDSRRSSLGSLESLHVRFCTH